VNDDAPSSVVYSDEKVMAFMDIRPINTGHVLIVPKTHSAGLFELEEEVGGHMFKVGLRIAEAIRKTDIECEGINLLLADGEAASQEVFHVHLHVIPRFGGDAFEIVGFKNATKPNRENLDETAEKIRWSYRLSE
jgi:histidine triad (HIT) family protein